MFGAILDDWGDDLYVKTLVILPTHADLHVFLRVLDGYGSIWGSILGSILGPFRDLHGKTRVNIQFIETPILYGKTR